MLIMCVWISHLSYVLLYMCIPADKCRYFNIMFVYNFLTDSTHVFGYTHKPVCPSTDRKHNAGGTPNPSANVVESWMIIPWVIFESTFRRAASGEREP